MKLKYILPFATIASIASVATPLATSCSSGKTGYTCSWTKDKGPYLPIDSKVGEPVADNNALTVAYHDDIKNTNKKIFSDDMVYSLYQFSLPSTFLKLQKISYTTNKIYDIEQLPNGTKYFRFDGKIVLDAIITYNTSILKFTNRKITIKNMPIRCEYNSNLSANVVGFINEFLKAEDTKFSITMPEIVKDTDNRFIVKENNKTYNRDVIKEIIDDDLELGTFIFETLWGYLFGCESNYYKNIIVGPTK